MFVTKMHNAQIISAGLIVVIVRDGEKDKPKIDCYENAYIALPTLLPKLKNIFTIICH